MAYLDEQKFNVGQIVESAHERGTLYRVTRYVPHGGPYQKGAAVTLELVYAGPAPDAELGLTAGRMADGAEVAVGHLQALPLKADWRPTPWPYDDAAAEHIACLGARFGRRTVYVWQTRGETAWRYTVKGQMTGWAGTGSLAEALASVERGQARD